MKKVCNSADGWGEPDYPLLLGDVFEVVETVCDGLDNDCDGKTDEGCNGCPVGTVVPQGWVCVPSGSFAMGSSNEQGHGDNETQHGVRLTHPFLFQVTEVTQDQWQSVMGNNPSYFQGANCAGDPCGKLPVEQITWYEAVAFCNALSLGEERPRCYTVAGGADYGAADAALETLPLWPDGLDCLGYRLPTEAEWEHAARATEGLVLATYNGDLDQLHLECEQPNEVLDDIAWFCGNSDYRTHPAATRDPNSWGLYDILGNVWEMCWDSIDIYPAVPVTDPLGPEHIAGDRGIAMRGGGYNSRAQYARAAMRNSIDWSNRESYAGLRLARTVPRP